MGLLYVYIPVTILAITFMLDKKRQNKIISTEDLIKLIAKDSQEFPNLAEEIKSRLEGGEPINLKSYNRIILDLKKKAIKAKTDTCLKKKAQEQADAIKNIE